MIREKGSPKVIVLSAGGVLTEFTGGSLRARVASGILGFAIGIGTGFGEATTTGFEFHFLRVSASFDRVDVKVIELPGFEGQAVVEIPSSEIKVVGGESVGELRRREDSSDGKGGKSE
jgi:hypothetical protein